MDILAVATLTNLGIMMVSTKQTRRGLASRLHDGLRSRILLLRCPSQDQVAITTRLVAGPATKCHLRSAEDVESVLDCVVAPTCQYICY